MKHPSVPLDSDQRLILRDGPQFITACPGSGKTRALIERFAVRSESDLRGKALLSFTNRAINECKERLRRQPHLLVNPNFVGTFDQFVHAFLVTPWMQGQGLGRPVLVDTLASLSAPPKVRTKIPGAGIGLWRFDFQVDSRSILNTSRLNREENLYLEQHKDKFQLETIASKKHQNLFGNSRIDCAMSRAIANHILTGDDGGDYLIRLRERFSEVLIDEMQDCDPIEISILESLTDSQLCVVGVADFDQAIFSFRGADRQVSMTFQDSYPPESRVTLNRNYRSPGDICQLLTSLRGRLIPIKSHENLPTFSSNIYVLEGSPSFALSSFEEIRSTYGISVDQSVVLSRRNQSRLETPTEDGMAGNNSFSDRLIDAYRVIKSPSSTIEMKLRAMKSLEARVFSLSNLTDDSGWPMARPPSTIGKARISIRDFCSMLFSALLESSGRLDAGKSIRKVFIEYMADELDPSINISQRIKAPTVDAWQSFTSIQHMSFTPKLSTIHAAKGGEWDAVLIQIDNSKPLNHWLNGEEDEERRILYVGASRARQVLAFWPCASTREPLIHALEDSEIGFNHIVEP